MLQRKNLKKLDLLKRKEWPQCHRETTWQVRQRRLCQKKKEQSRQLKVSDNEGERVKMGEGHTLTRRRSEREHEKEKVDSTVKKGGFQGGKGRQAIRASLREVEGNMSG